MTTLFGKKNESWKHVESFEEIRIICNVRCQLSQTNSILTNLQRLDLEINTDCVNKRRIECIFSKSKQHTSLSHARITDQKEFEKQIELPICHLNEIYTGTIRDHEKRKKAANFALHLLFGGSSEKFGEKRKGRGPRWRCIVILIMISSFSGNIQLRVESLTQNSLPI